MSLLEKTSAAAASSPSDELSHELGLIRQLQRSKKLSASNGNGDHNEGSEAAEENGDSAVGVISSVNNDPSNKSGSSVIKGNDEEKQKPINTRPPEPPPAKMKEQEGCAAQVVKKITVNVQTEAASSAGPKSLPTTATNLGNKSSPSKASSIQSIDTAVFKYCKLCRNAFLRQEQLDSHMRSYHPDKYEESHNSTPAEKNSKDVKSSPPPLKTDEKSALSSTVITEEKFSKPALPPPPSLQAKVKTPVASSSISTSDSSEKILKTSAPPPLLAAKKAPIKLPGSPTENNSKSPQRPPPLQAKANLVPSSPATFANLVSKSPEQPNTKLGTSTEQVQKKFPVQLPPPPQPFVCADCGKKFLVKANYEEHIKSHSQKEEFKKPVSSESSEKVSISNFKPKINNVPTKERRRSPEAASGRVGSPPRRMGPGLKCEFCDRTFPQPFLLRKHMEIHNQQYECSICGSRYMKIEGLNLHKRVLHDDAGMNKFKCLLCDKKDMILMSEWYSHRLEKHGQVPFHVEKEKPFACNVCKQRFHRKGDAYVCALLGHDPSSLYEAMFLHKCPECSAEKNHLGYHSIRALKKHWNKEHSDKIFPTDVLLAESGYSFDAPLPKVVIDKREAYDLMTNGPPKEAKQEDGSPLILEFDNLTESEMKCGEDRCVISAFSCPDCPLTFVDVDSLTIHEQVHLQDEGPPTSPSSPIDAKKRGRPPTKTNHFVTVSSDSTSPVAPISLLPPANGFRGKHLVAKYKCVTCGKKFRKLKRLRDHEQTHLNMNPHCATYPKVSGRGGRKPGLLKKKKSSSFLGGGGGGIQKKRGRPRKIPFWVPSAAAAQQMKSGGGGGGGGNIEVTSQEASEDPEESHESEHIQKAYRCKLCPAGFSIAKSLRIHELRFHDAPHKKPGRKPGKTSGSQAATTVAKNDGNEDSDPSSEVRPLAPGRIRVGRLEISTKLNKMIKQNTPIEIRVTDEVGGTATHLQCPLCPKIFRDKRGIHLHILGHSLKDSDSKESEKKSRSPEGEEEEEEYQGKKNFQSPSAISSTQRRTSDRERRVPRKLSEYDVDDDEAAAAVMGATKEVESTPAAVSSVPPPVKIKKDGRGRPRKYPLPIVEKHEGDEGPTTSFKEISGEILGSRLRSKTVDEISGQGEKSEAAVKMAKKRSEDDELDDENSVSDEDPEPPPPPRAQRLLCKACGDSFDSVMELWCHGNEVHRRTKVKYVPNAAAAAAATASKSEEKKVSSEVVPGTSHQQNMVKPLNKPVAIPNVYPGKKNPAVLALLQKRREQMSLSINNNGATASMTKPAEVPAKIATNVEVPKKPAGPSPPAAQEKFSGVQTTPSIVKSGTETVKPGSSDSVKLLHDVVKKGRPPKNKLVNNTDPPTTSLSPLSTDELGVMRIGQLKIAPELLNKSREVLEKEPPEIIIEVGEDGEVIKRNKCPRCPKTFKDFRGLPFHMLCHIMKTEGKTKKSSKSLTPSTSTAVSVTMMTTETLKREGVESAVENKKEEKVEVLAEKLEKKMPGLIPLGGIKKRGRPQKWIVNLFQKKQDTSTTASTTTTQPTVNGVKKVKVAQQQKEPLPSTSRTSSIITTTGTTSKLQPSSENQVPPPPPQIVIKTGLEVERNSAAGEAMPKPILSPTSNEFRFKIIKQSRILPFDDQLNQQSPSTTVAAAVNNDGKTSAQQQLAPPPLPATSSSSLADVSKLAVNKEKKDHQENSKKIEEESVVVGKAQIAPPPVIPEAGVTSLQTEPDHVNEIQKKKAKMTAILAKARLDPETTITPLPKTSTASSSEQGNSSSTSAAAEIVKDVKKETEEVVVVVAAEKKVNVTAAAVDSQPSVAAPTPTTQLKKEDTVESPVVVEVKSTISLPTSTCSPETATLKRKRGRPRKDSLPVSVSAAAIPVVSQQQSLSVSKPAPVENADDLSREKAEMAAMQKVEREVRQSMKTVEKATPPAEVVVASEDQSLMSPPVKRKGRPPKKKRGISALTTPLPAQALQQKQVDDIKITSQRSPAAVATSCPVKIEDVEMVNAVAVDTPAAPSLKRKLERTPTKTPENTPAAAVEAGSTPESAVVTEDPPVEVKRGRGRPRKYPVVIASSTKVTAELPVEQVAIPTPPIRVPSSFLSPDITSITNLSGSSVGGEAGGGNESVVKRGRGRPRKSMPVLTRADDEDEASSSQ